MNKNIEKFNELIDVVGKATIHPACEEFNILDEVRVDENAHTRILAGLLREKTLRCQFLEMIRREVSMRSQTESGDGQCGCIENLMSDANIANVADNGIRVFSKYIDALIISPNNFAVIIENKVKGAEDQDRQVERYIETVKDSEGLDVKRIIVVYLTRDGGDPSENSLSPETRAELGAYLPLNYEKHILHWLKHGLTFSRFR